MIISYFRYQFEEIVKWFSTYVWSIAEFKEYFKTFKKKLVTILKYYFYRQIFIDIEKSWSAFFLSLFFWLR